MNVLDLKAICGTFGNTSLLLLTGVSSDLIGSGIVIFFSLVVPFKVDFPVNTLLSPPKMDSVFSFFNSTPFSVRAASSAPSIGSCNCDVVSSLGDSTMLDGVDWPVLSSSTIDATVVEVVSLVFSESFFKIPLVTFTSKPFSFLATSSAFFNRVRRIISASSALLPSLIIATESDDVVSLDKLVVDDTSLLDIRAFLITSASSEVIPSDIN